MVLSEDRRDRLRYGCCWVQDREGGMNVTIQRNKFIVLYDGTFQQKLWGTRSVVHVSQLLYLICTGVYLQWWFVSNTSVDYCLCSYPIVIIYLYIHRIDSGSPSPVVWYFLMIFSLRLRLFSWHTQLPVMYTTGLSPCLGNWIYSFFSLIFFIHIISCCVFLQMTI